MPKHADVLLKMKPPTDVEEEAKIKKERDDNLNNLQTKLRAIFDLSQTAGWKLFVEDLKNEELQLLSKLEKASDPTSLAKLTGTLIAVKGFQNWAAYTMRETDSQAKALADEN